MVAGCFISNQSFLIGGGLERTSPNLEGTFRMFLNLVLSCPSTVCYENVNTATICIVLLLLTWPVPISVSANIGNFRTTLAATTWYWLFVGYKQWSSIRAATSLTTWFRTFGVICLFSIMLIISISNWCGTRKSSSHPSALAGTFAWILVETSSYNYVIWIFSWYLCFIFTSAATDGTCSQ